MMWYAGWLFLYRVEHGFHRDRDKLFYFFSTAAGPLCNNDDLRIRYVGESFHGRILITHIPYYSHYRCEKKTR